MKISIASVGEIAAKRKSVFNSPLNYFLLSKNIRADCLFIQYVYQLRKKDIEYIQIMQNISQEKTEL